MKENKKFPTELKKMKAKAEQEARECGLDFFPIIFEVLGWKELLETAARGGFPVRYPHYTFGDAYNELNNSYRYGLSKIYEMVVNTDPCYAYLLECNEPTDQKIVMAHVYAHCDFFKNNVYFKDTNRKMLDEMASHAARIQRHINKYGYEKVEKFIDLCRCADDLIDPDFGEKRKPEINEEEEKQVKKIKAKGYMDDYINTPDFIRKQEEKIKKEKEKNAEVEKKMIIPKEPERDVMLFLMEHAPLEKWQKDILAIIREESYYFLPQMKTKIMNEGWAAYWHSLMMTGDPERNPDGKIVPLLTDKEIIDYSDHHSGTMSSPGLNPYKIGIEIFKDIEDRWNKGKFGKEYNGCKNWEERKNWDKKLGKGREKIFEVRRSYNDVNFIDEFLTPELCVKLKLFNAAYDGHTGYWRISSREYENVKKNLIFSLFNAGRPIIRVIDGNYRNKNELYLRHSHEIDLDPFYNINMLQNLYQIWKRPIHLETKEGGKKKVWSINSKKKIFTAK